MGNFKKGAFKNDGVRSVYYFNRFTGKIKEKHKRQKQKTIVRIW